MTDPSNPVSDAPSAAAPAAAPTGILARLASSDRWVALLLALAALYLFGWGIGSYSLLDPWEPKYAQAMRDMSERGDFITPYLNDKIRWTKPILIYWLMYLPTKILGNNELSMRIGPVLVGVGGVLLMFYFLRRLRGMAAGIIGACVLMTLPQYFFVAREAVPDMLLNVCMLGAMAFFGLARFSKARRDLHLTLFYVSVALGFLTKGPLAPVLTLFALALFSLLDLEPAHLTSLRRLRTDVMRLWRDYRVGRGLLTFALVSGPWYGAMLVIHGGEFLDSFFFDENISRFAEPLWGHTGKITKYLTTIFHGMYPWVTFLPVGVPLLFARYRKQDEESRFVWYILTWFLASFLLFTAASTKLDHYILPITPALAVLVALFLEVYLKRPSTEWVRPALVISLGFMILTFKDFVFESDRYLMNVFLPAQDLWAGADAVETELKIFLVAWIVVISAAWFKPGSRVLLGLAIVAAFGNGVFFSHVALPQHAPERCLQGYIEVFDQVEEPDAELVFYGHIRHSLTYYKTTDVKIFEPEEVEELVRYVRQRPNMYIIAQSESMDDILEDLHIAGAERWTLLSDDHPIFSLISNKPRLRKGRVAPKP